MEPVLSVRQLTKSFVSTGGTTDVVTALEDLSFDLYPGETLGVIGPNGAGKSTLLKVLGQITAPTSGEFSYAGRLTSIIEVGTGFHPDLSGRENVFLSGSFNGHSRRQVEALYPDLVEFSGLEDVMDRQVKHYSSGMYLRLAFSIAFHIQTDILLLDEVLSVGDAEFRRKCHHKIHEASNNGTSIILVSHSANQVLEFCDRCLMLDHGKLAYEGEPMETLEYYRSRQEKPTREAQPAVAEPVMRLEKLERQPTTFYRDEPVVLEFDVVKTINDTAVEVMMAIADVNGNRILADANVLNSTYQETFVPEGTYRVRCTIPPNFLNRGSFTLGVSLSTEGRLEVQYFEVYQFKILLRKDAPHRQMMKQLHTPIIFQFGWDIQAVSDASSSTP